MLEALTIVVRDVKRNTMMVIWLHFTCLCLFLPFFVSLLPTSSIVSLMLNDSSKPKIYVNMLSNLKPLCKIQKFNFSFTHFSSTTSIGNLIVYSLKVSFFLYIMKLSITIVLNGCFWQVKGDVNSLKSALQELIQLSSIPLNQVIIAPFNVRNKIFHFTMILAWW